MSIETNRYIVFYSSKAPYTKRAYGPDRLVTSMVVSARSAKAAAVRVNRQYRVWRVALILEREEWES